MKKLAPILSVMAVLSGCGMPTVRTTIGDIKPASIASQTQSATAFDAAPLASPAVDSVPLVETETLQTTKEMIESKVRDMLRDSNIASLTIELKTAGELQGNQRQSASRVVSSQSPVWEVTAIGDLMFPGKIPSSAGLVGAVAPTGNSMVIVLSGQDARPLSLSLRDPKF